MKTYSKTILVVLVFLCGIIAGNYLTSSAEAFQDHGLGKRNSTNLGSNPDGRSIRALSNLMLDLTQAINGNGEHREAQAEARAVVAELKNFSLSGTSKHEGFLKASRLFSKLERYTKRRGQDRNTRESCAAASRMFLALSKMENDTLSENEQEREAAGFFYALADIFKLERTDRNYDVAGEGEEELMRSLGDICKAESKGSDKETRKALGKMFRSLGTIATQEK